MYNKADFYRGLGQLRKGLSQNLSSNPHIDLNRNIEVIFKFFNPEIEASGIKPDLNKKIGWAPNFTCNTLPEGDPYSLPRAILHALKSNLHWNLIFMKTFNIPLDCITQVNAYIPVNQSVYQEANISVKTVQYGASDIKLFQKYLRKIEIITNICVYDRDTFEYGVKNDGGLITIDLFTVNNCFYFSTKFSFN